MRVCMKHISTPLHHKVVQCKKDDVNIAHFQKTLHYHYFDGGDLWWMLGLKHKYVCKYETIDLVWYFYDVSLLCNCTIEVS